MRLDTGDIVRRLPACACGDPRPPILVLGRDGDVVPGRIATLYPYEIIEAAAAAADALDSSVFFAIVLPDRLLVRIEVADVAAVRPPPAHEALRAHLGDIPVEVECTPGNTLLDVEHLARSPSVYKPVLVSDWTRPGRHPISVEPGNDRVAEPELRSEALRFLSRGVRASFRRRRLEREHPAGQSQPSVISTSNESHFAIDPVALTQSSERASSGRGRR